MARSRLVVMAACIICLAAVGCGGDSTEQRIERLHNGDPKVRQAAARALAEAHDDVPAAVAALAGAMSDPDYEVREEAAQSLGEIGADARSSLSALEGVLNDRHASVRIAAALAIHSIDPESQTCVPVLRDALLAGNGPVFLEVARMGPAGEWAVPTLMTLLSHEHASIRALAAHALGRIGAAATRALPTLQRRLRDEQPAVRKAARNAIEQINSNGSEARQAAKTTR